MERNLMCLLPEYPVSKNPLTVQLIAIIDIGLYNRRPNQTKKRVARRCCERTREEANLEQPDEHLGRRTKTKLKKNQ